MPRTFSILDLKRFPGSPTCVPWGFMAPHDAQARRNHSQSLERLNERGGCDPTEILAIVEGRGWHKMEPAQATALLNELLRDYEEVQIQKVRSAVPE